MENCLGPAGPRKKVQSPSSLHPVLKLKQTKTQLPRSIHSKAHLSYPSISIAIATLHPSSNLTNPETGIDDNNNPHQKKEAERNASRPIPLHLPLLVAPSIRRENSLLHGWRGLNLQRPGPRPRVSGRRRMHHRAKSGEDRGRGQGYCWRSRGGARAGSGWCRC